MARDADLAGKNHVLANLRRTRQSSLCAQQRVFAHRRAMAHLH